MRRPFALTLAASPDLRPVPPVAAHRLVSSCSAPGADRPAAVAQQATPAFPSEVQLITVDAVVLNALGRPVRDLTQDDFTVTEDGHPQEIVRFEAFTESSARRGLRSPSPPWPATRAGRGPAERTRSWWTTWGSPRPAADSARDAVVVLPRALGARRRSRDPRDDERRGLVERPHAGRTGRPAGGPRAHQGPLRRVAVSRSHDRTTRRSGSTTTRTRPPSPASTRTVPSAAPADPRPGPIPPGAGSRSG